MIKQAYDLRKVNPRLVKKLQKYLLSALLVVVLLFFGYRLFKVDTYGYYNKLSSREILALPKEGQTEESLDSIVQTLNNNGMEVESYYNVYLTSFVFKANGKEYHQNTYIAKDSRYIEGILGKTLKWIFKSDSLSDEGVYLDIDTYNALGNPRSVEVVRDSLYHGTSYGIYRVEGVYSANKTTKSIFYGSYSVNLYTVLSPKILSKGLDLKVDSFFIETKKDISKQDLVLINQLFEQSWTAVGNIEEANILTNYIFNGIIRMIIVVVCLTLLITAILIYQFVNVSSSILSIWLIYYMSNTKAILTSILSLVLQVLKPTLITGLVLTVLIVGVYIYIGYAILLPLLALLAIYVSIILLGSIMYLVRFWILKNTLNKHIEAECLK